MQACSSTCASDHTVCTVAVTAVVTVDSPAGSRCRCLPCVCAVCAEWFYGGQPLWLHDSGFAFREYNPGWTEYMENMMTAVVKHVEPWLARNGGSSSHTA
jgi:hypothetical protein